jgi:hypothetical protein
MLLLYRIFILPDIYGYPEGFNQYEPLSGFNMDIVPSQYGSLINPFLWFITQVRTGSFTFALGV